MFPLFNAPRFLHRLLLRTHPLGLPVRKSSTCSTSYSLHTNQRQSAELKKSCGRGDPGRYDHGPSVLRWGASRQSGSTTGQAGQIGLGDWQESRWHHGFWLRITTEAPADPSHAAQWPVSLPKMRGLTECRRAITPERAHPV
jgi:hypothetical protein